jgi:spermidine synthase
VAHRQRDGRVVAETDSGLAELVGDPDRPRAFTLLVDGFLQSHVDLDDPRRLEFGYMRLLGHLADLAPGDPLRVLHLGGGALTLARYVAATRPGARQLVIESDAALVGLVRDQLPLDQPGRRVRVRVGDARDELAGLREGSCDLVVADLFAQGRTPRRLGSAEFAAQVARTLSPAGILAVNIADGPPLEHARARVAALGAVFGQVCVMAETAVLRGRRSGNLVAAASRADLPLTALARRVSAGGIPGRLVYGAELARFTAGARPLTDATAR